MEKCEMVGVDPYSLKKSECGQAVEDFPKVYISDIQDYLVNSKSAFTVKSFRAYKSLDSYKFFEVGWVYDCMTKKINENIVVLGRVNSKCFK